MNCDKNIIIAIPCLREQKCIEDTIKYFTRIAKDIPIIIVTTQKEVKENIKNDILTQDIIKNKVFPKYKNVYLIDYPYTEGYMADQLNYMIERIKDKINCKNTYLVLYNADSRPNEKTFDEIKEKLAEGHKVIQQYSYCMKNYNELNNILKGFSIYQSNFEMKTGLINSLLNSKLLYTHVVGHGLIINMETLNELQKAFNGTFKRAYIKYINLLQELKDRGLVECDVFMLLTADYDTICKRNKTRNHVLDGIWIDEETILSQREVLEKMLNELVGCISKNDVKKTILDTSNLSKKDVLDNFNNILNKCERKEFEIE